jgi:hypothetical protein
MTEALDALLGLLLFNVLLVLIVLASSRYKHRRGRGRWHEATRRLMGFGVREDPVPPWEPYAAAVEERRAARSARNVPMRD